MVKYNKINDKDIAYFKTFISKENILVGDEISLDFAKDELGTVSSKPDVMIYVFNAEEISKIMKHANERRIPVVVRGSGTGLVGASVPLYHGIMINISKMNHILELDENNLTLTVESGVLLMDIYSYVESRGYFYAPDPGEKSATIGGNIATNAGGMRAVKYGVTRDWVRSLEVVLPTGEIEIFGRKVVKDSTGYSLKNLLIGSEGTLGIISKAILRLEPKPNESLSLLVPFTSIEKALDAVPLMIRKKVSPTAIEFFEKKTISFAEKYLGKAFPNKNSDAFILLTFEGRNHEELEHNYKSAADIFLDELGANDALIIDTNERKDLVWKSRGAFLEAIKASSNGMDECDVVVPRSEIANYIKFTYELAKKYKIRIPSFGHAGDGNLHIYICRDNYNEKEFNEILKKVFLEMYHKATEMGGLISGEHGIGYAKKQYMQESLGKKQVELMRGIKDVFDPNHILNPGKIAD